jgi:hypothetical protein
MLEVKYCVLSKAFTYTTTYWCLKHLASGFLSNLQVPICQHIQHFATHLSLLSHARHVGRSYDFDRVPCMYLLKAFHLFPFSPFLLPHYSYHSTKIFTMPLLLRATLNSSTPTLRVVSFSQFHCLCQRLMSILCKCLRPHIRHHVFRGAIFQAYLAAL